MKIPLVRRIFAGLLAAVLVLGNPYGSRGTGLTAYAYTETAAQVMASSLNVRSGAGTSYSKVTSLSAGTSVTITDEVQGQDGKTWAQIRFNGGTGFVQKSYLRTSVAYQHDGDFESMLAGEGFPESYKVYLRQVHAQYPAWVFRSMNTGLSWDEVIREESVVGRNLTDENSKSSWKSTDTGAFDWKNNYWPGFDSSRWVAASRGVISYYMDPRNFLNPTYIFQFLTQSYDASTQTADGVEALAKGTFLEGTASGSGTSPTPNGGAGLSPVGGGPGTTQSPTGAAGAAGTAVSPGGQAVSPEAGAGQGTPSPDGQAQGAAQSSDPQAAQSGSGGAPVSGGSVSIGAAPGGSAGTAQQPAAGGDPQPSSSGAPQPEAAGAPQGASPEGAGASSGTSQGTGASSGAPQNTGAPSGAGQGASPVGVISGAPQAKAPEAGEGTDALKGILPDIPLVEVPEIQGRVSVSASGVIVGPGRSSMSPSSTSSTPSAGGGSSSGNVNYIDIIMKAAQASGVNPYVLTAMILQEQGTRGKSGLISGKNGSYPGVYNFFNIMAYEDGSMTAVTRGLWWASQSGAYERPWNSIEKAVVGGAEYYGENFVRRGQDTLYLKKFNVTGNSRYQHQYMTNVQGAADEGYKLGEAYSESMKQLPLVFRIPVYSGMPDTPAEAPTGDGSPNNKLRTLAADGFSMNPAFSLDTENYDLTVDTSVQGLNISASAIDSGASVSGAGYTALNADQQTIEVRVTAGNGDVRSYFIRVRREAGGQTGSGFSGSGAGSAAQGGGSSGPFVNSGPGVSGGASPGGASPGGASPTGSASQAEVNDGTPFTPSQNAGVSLVGPAGS